MSAAAPAGSSSTRISAFNAASSSAESRALRYAGSRSSACRMPSPRIPPSPREAPRIVHSRSRPFESRRRASSPPGPRSSDIDMPDDVPISTPARPGASWPGSGSSVSVTSWRRAVAWPRTEPLVAAVSEPVPQPSREASQPKKSTPAAPESGRWRTLTESMCQSSSRQRGGSNVEATRSRHGVVRSQARSTTYASALSSSARFNALAGSGSFTESIRATWEM